MTLDLTHNQNAFQNYQRPQTPLFPSQPQDFIAGSTPPQLPQLIAQALYNQSKFSGLQLSQDVGPNNSQAPTPSLLQPSQQVSLTDTVSAITADPNFPAALTAAISSIIGGANPNNNNNSSNPNVINSATINQ